MESFVKEIKRVRVSSVLNKDVKQFGKQFLFDGKDDTCWNSSESSIENHSLRERCFQKCKEDSPTGKDKVLPNGFLLILNDRFTWKNCLFVFKVASLLWNFPLKVLLLPIRMACGFCKRLTPQMILPNKFPLPNCPHSQLKVVFNISADFYGRITIYELDIVGFPECQLS